MTGTTSSSVAVGVWPPPTPKAGRRLSDKILRAFEQACEQSEFEVAQRLLGALELLLACPTRHKAAERRHGIESLVAAHERLWDLRHPEAGRA